MKTFYNTFTALVLLILLACIVMPICSCRDGHPSDLASLKEELHEKQEELWEMEEDTNNSWRWLTHSPWYNINLQRNIAKTQKEVDDLKYRIDTIQGKVKVYLTQIDIRDLPNHNLGKLPTKLSVFYKASDFDSNTKGDLLYKQKRCPSTTTCPITPERIVQSGSTLIFMDKTGVDEVLANLSLDLLRDYALDRKESTGEYRTVVETTHRGHKEKATYILHYRKVE